MPSVQSHRMPRPAGAFTLMELLVVITIIAILASMLLPIIKRVKEAALHANCANNIRQVLLAGVAYGTDNEGYLPPYSADMTYYYASGSFYLNGVSNNYLTDRIGYSYSDYTFFKCLWPDYVQNPKVFFCPRGGSPQKNWISTVWGAKTTFIYRFLSKNATGYYLASTLTAKGSNSLLINEPTRTPWSTHSGERPQMISGVGQAGASHGYSDGHVEFIYPNATGWYQSISPFF